jgi:predicted ABC-type ATPase
VTQASPRIVLLAGPNGAGKSTAAAQLLQGPLEVSEFVNADGIAHGISAFNTAEVAFEAGGVMLKRLRTLAEGHKNFAFETTLASRSFGPWISELRRSGYTFLMVFLWLPNADVAVARVAGRARMGGHDVPEDTVRRRYHRGLQNFFTIYRPLADQWWMYDSSRESGPDLIANGRNLVSLHIEREPTWADLERMHANAG